MSSTATLRRCTPVTIMKVFGREQYAVEEFDDINDQLALSPQSAVYFGPYRVDREFPSSNIGFG